MTPTCEHCRHWRADDYDPEAGTCRRYPPTVATHEYERDGYAYRDTEGVFPPVSAADSCGEFQPKEDQR